MNESREEFDYSLDDDFDESVVSGKGGISPSSKNRFMNKQLEGLNEKSVDSYSNDFDGIDQVKGSESLHEKSYLSEYTQDFNSPVEKGSTGSDKEKEYHTQSKVDSEPSNEYQDDFLQEKSSVLLDENTPITTMNNLPSTHEIDQLPKENNIDYGEDFFEGSLKEEEETPKAPESEQKEDDVAHHSAPIPAPIIATKSGDSVGNSKSGDNYDDFLSISANSPMADALKSRSLDPLKTVPPMQPEEFNAALFETTMDSGLFPNYSPSPTATTALVPDSTVEPSIMKPKLSPKTSVLHLQELIKEKEDLFAPLPDDHSSIGSNQEKPQNKSQIDNHIDGEVEGGDDERRNSASYDASFEEKTSLAQLVNDPIDEDNSLYLLEDEEEVKKQEAKEEQLLQEYSDFVRRSSEASLYKTDSSNFFKSSKTITSPLPVTEEEEGHDQASLVSNLKEGSSLLLPEKEKISDEIKREEEGEENKYSDARARVEEEEDDAILRDSALLMTMDPRPESPGTIELKNNLTEEGINRVKRLSENFMDNVFHHSSKTSPRDDKALKDLEESVKVSEEQIRAIKEETNSLSDLHSLNPPVQQSSVPPSQREYENDLEEDDKPFIYPKNMFEEEEEFIYPAEPDLSTNHVSPLKPSNQAKNRTAPKSQKSSQNALLDSLERYEAPPAKSAGKRPSSSSAPNSNPNSSRRASTRPNSSSQKVNQLRNTVETNRKASVREILAASTTPVAQIKKSKISSEQLSAQRMKEFVLSKPNNPLRFNVAENCLVLTEVCIHRKNFQRCSSMFCQEAFKKYQWMKLMRKKSALAIELLESADELWKKKLDQSLEEAVESLTEEQENEVQVIAKKLSLHTTNDKKLFKTLRYMKKHDLDKDEHKKIQYEEYDLTFDHYTFLTRQLELRKDFNYHRKKAILDHLRFEHLQQRDLLRKSISLPTIYLARMRRDFLAMINFHKDRVEKMILYILNICLQPKLLHPITTSEQTLLQNRIFKASLQAFDFLKVGLLSISSICQKVREIYCSPDDKIMQSYLNNYKNPLTSTSNEEGEEGDENIDENNGRKQRPRTSSPVIMTSKLKKNKFSRFYGSFDEEDGEGGDYGRVNGRRRTASGRNRPGSRSRSRGGQRSSPARPQTAPENLTSSGSANKKGSKGFTNAMRSFSPKYGSGEEEGDFQTVPFSRNNSYYSDFDDVEGKGSSGIEEKGNNRIRGDSYESYNSIIDEEDLAHHRSSGDEIRTMKEDDDTAILTAELGEDEIEERHLTRSQSPPYNESDFEKPSKSEQSPSKDDVELIPRTKSLNDVVPDRKKKKPKTNSSNSANHMVITKKDLLIAQMKDTKLNTSLLLQDMLSEHNIPSLSQQSFVKSSLSNSYTVEDEEEAKMTEEEEKKKANDLEKEKRRQQRQTMKQQTSSAQKKIQCSYCHNYVLQQTIKRFPQLLNHNDDEVIAKANDFLQTNLYKNLEKLNPPTLKREEYLYLYQKLVKKLKYSVKKSSKRYSHVKNMNDGHLVSSTGSFMSGTSSYSGSFDDFAPPSSANSPLRPVRQSQQERSDVRYKAHHPAPHHDASFCSYECMKRWTVYYCPVQFKYESEILIDMVAGYKVKV
mmetsp:Transcript_25370/g.27727  ORF Transcript_25370/g.27727 Transcript_25370/m.27727 type:complete len:1598 (+) Transcript_25370:138-4931(+)